MTVPVLDLKRQYQEIKNEVMQAVGEIFENQHFILGKNGAGLEEECARFLDIKATVGVASGTDAILVSLKAMDLKPGDGVITSSFTFFATAGAIHNAKGIPFFVDIEPVTFNLDPAKLKEFLLTQCEKTDKGVIHKKSKTPIRGVLPVHLYGASCEMDEILKIAKEYKLFVLEDSCQAFGSKYRGRRVGTFGELSAFSFFPTKNLGGAGDGGLISTPSEDLANRLKKIRVHGSERRYYHDEIGYNSRLDELQAAVLRIKLRHLDKWNQKRREAADLYYKGLSKIDGVVAPTAPAHIEHIYHQYVIRAKNRDGLKDYLESKGIGSMIYYPVPLHQQVCFEFLGYKTGDLPVTEKAAGDVLALPIFAELKAEEIGEVVREIGNYYSGNGKK
jgi:dTDP-4-amino-4,6-dideoxygalactose transaminase